jgi:prepilin-type processing-associated H-X9-DG protein
MTKVDDLEQLSPAARKWFDATLATHSQLTSAGKVLLVEYRKSVADVAGSTARDSWRDLYQARHNNTINMVFKDGHVENKLPDDVNPQLLVIMNTLWLPEALAGQ